MRASVWSEECGAVSERDVASTLGTCSADKCELSNLWENTQSRNEMNEQVMNVMNNINHNRIDDMRMTCEAIMSYKD